MITAGVSHETNKTMFHVNPLPSKIHMKQSLVFFEKKVFSAAILLGFKG